MVIGLLTILVACGLSGSVLFLIGSNKERTPFVIGWLTGLFLAATSFVLFYQLFPHVSSVAPAVTGG